MQGNRIAIPFHFGGTLAANQQASFRLPANSTGYSLVAVSASAENDSDATLQIGTDDDADGILTASVIGDSGVPTIYDKGDWNGALTNTRDTPHFAGTEVFKFVLDFDGAAGTAAQNVTILFMFSEG